MSTALRSLGLLEVLSSTPVGSSVALAGTRQMRLVSMPVCAASLQTFMNDAGLRAVSLGMHHRIRISLPAIKNAQGRGARFDRTVSSLWKLRCFLHVLVWLLLGLLLLFLPWQPAWENNYLLYLYPRFRPLVANPFLKGFVMGLGFANILIGIYEVAQLREQWKAKRLPR
jgi:hypothetical protein